LEDRTTIQWRKCVREMEKCVSPGCVELHENVLGVVDDDIVEGFTLGDGHSSCAILFNYLNSWRMN
jgi:hypothetical protein